MVLVRSYVGCGMLLLCSNFVGILQNTVSIQDITGNEWLVHVFGNLVLCESAAFLVVKRDTV